MITETHINGVSFPSIRMDIRTYLDGKEKITGAFESYNEALNVGVWLSSRCASEYGTSYVPKFVIINVSVNGRVIFAPVFDSYGYFGNNGNSGHFSGQYFSDRGYFHY